MQNQNPPESLKSDLLYGEVYHVVKKLGEAIIKKDTDSLSIILDSQFTLTHITGYVQSKKEWIHEIVEESMKYYSINELEHAIHLNENNASVRMRSLVDARVWGHRNTWRLQQNLELEKRNEDWIILNSVASMF
jgi:hypothetical protein